jgi:hypothetical protein
LNLSPTASPLEGNGFTDRREEHHPQRNRWHEWDSNPQSPRFELGRFAGLAYRADSKVAQEGFEPSASLVLSESGLPVAYRASFHFSSGGWNRTSVLHVQSVVLLPAATTPESSHRFDSIREEGFEPSPPDSKSGGLPISRFPSGRRGSRTLKAHRSPDFESGAVTHRLALPSTFRSRPQVPSGSRTRASAMARQ